MSWGLRIPSDLHKFVLFHLMECIPFDMPHTIYLDILHITKTLGCNDDIYYVALLNKYFGSKVSIKLPMH